MTRRSPIPPSPAFEVWTRGVQFRDRIAVVVKAPPAAIFQAPREVITGSAAQLHRVHQAPKRQLLRGRFAGAPKSTPADKRVPAGEEPCVLSHLTR